MLEMPVEEITLAFNLPFLWRASCGGMDTGSAIMGLIGTDSNDVGRTVVKPYEITASSEFERAKLDLLSRVHSTDYLAFVNDLSKELERRQKEEEEAASGDSDDQRTGTLTPPVVPFTPMVS